MESGNNTNLSNLIKSHNPILDVICYNEVGSTNEIAHFLAKKGAKEGTLILAESQTAGRGRLGRTFHSKKGGIYLSIILRPEFSAEISTLITASAAVAAARVLEKVSGRDCLIKWVNDIFINSKKVCGILTEGAFNTKENRLDYVVLGVGINLTSAYGDLPQDIKESADFLFYRQVSEDIKAEIIGEFTKEFFAFYKNIDKKEFISEYKRRSFLTGKEISYEKDGVIHNATVIGIDENARLITNENGKEVIIGAGDVSVKYL